MVGALSSEHGNNMANKLELANNMANMTKSNLDNIVGSLWQARQESSGSSRGDQVIKKIVESLCKKKGLRSLSSLALTGAAQPEHGKWSRTDPKTSSALCLCRVHKHMLILATKTLPKVRRIKGRVCGVDNGGENRGIWTLEPSQHSVGRTFNGSLVIPLSWPPHPH